MTSWTFDNEFAQKLERTVEQYWWDGMSLSDARKKAFNELVGNGTSEASSVVGHSAIQENWQARPTVRA